ncbi:Metallophosphoesterase [Thalictrum thalictroides]|uniref:Metallophosphoesterase n=1 Tax=Thalictrum thalictroides TaxID=46969 RepID=A0A7J6WGY2_THATH|nr:Metallophosphoesterase [Thalictrum thalictroides]
MTMRSSSSKMTIFLCCIWVLSLLYGEMISFWVPYLWTCSWPQLPSHSSKMVNETAYLGRTVKVAVLADPQLTDKTSHGLATKSLALEMIQFYTDLYMRRSFLASVLPFKPDLILFLGDYFDGGPHLSDEEWQNSLSRFKHIFNIDHNGRSSGIPVYYISGNHDIGYGGLLSRYPKVISRYEEEFGPRNHQFSVGKVEFVAVDSQTLDGPKHGSWTSKSWNFVKNISTDGILSPRVLLTHIPLYRPDWTPCGVQRSSRIINQRLTRSPNDQEIMYQDYLTEETSGLLLDMVRPALVLSGHDHDQCTVTHLTRDGHVTEHTVGTLSWQQGNLYPSFMLLSASNHAFTNITNPEDAVSTQLCFLPMQTHIYIWYLSLFVFTVLVLIIWPRAGLGCWNWQNDILGSIGRALSSMTSKVGNKEKDDDDPCEYEEIWDAEGSMHLVKKALKKPDVKHSIDSRSVGRSNVMVRPSAKKQDLESSFELKINTDVHLDDGGKILQKSDKVKRKSIILQIVRTLRLLMVIAAVNIPLYMMLLFKDWSEQ